MNCHQNKLKIDFKTFHIGNLLQKCCIAVDIISMISHTIKYLSLYAVTVIDKNMVMSTGNE